MYCIKTICARSEIFYEFKYSNNYANILSNWLFIKLMIECNLCSINKHGSFVSENRNDIADFFSS